MYNLGLLEYILIIIWFFSIILILAAIYSNHSSGRVTFIVATLLTAFFYTLPEEILHGVANSFYRNVFVPFPATVISAAVGILVAYIYLFSYVSVYEPEDPPPQVKPPGKTD